MWINRHWRRLLPLLTRQDIEKGPDAKANVTWRVAIRPGKRKALDKENGADAMIYKAEKLKAGVRAKVEHAFRVVKRQFGFVKVLYRGLKKMGRSFSLCLRCQTCEWCAAS